MFGTYFNTTDTPVVVSADGRSIDGEGWGPADPDDERAAAVIAAGLIVEIDQPGRGTNVNPDAAAAIQATKQLNDTRPASEPANDPEEQ